MATPLTNAIVATSDNIADGAVTFLGYMLVGPNNVPAAVQIPAEAFLHGLPLDSVASAVQLSGITTNTTPVVLSGIPSLPNQICALRLQGTVTAYNSQTGDTISWDIAGLVKQTGVGIAPILLNSSITIFYADTSMTGCVLEIGSDSQGIAIIFTGLPATNISVVSSILFSPRSTV